MPPKLLRLLLVFASTSIALLAAAWAWSRWLRPSDLLEFHQAGDFEIEPADEASAAEPGRPSRALLAAEKPEDWKYYLRHGQVLQLYGGSANYDPWTYVRWDAFQDFDAKWPDHPRGGWRQRTNGEGLREDHELAERQADLRVLVAGDSHTFGNCDNHDSFPNLLEARLAELHPGKEVEVLNAASGGYSLFNYFGTLLRFREFAPQVFVVAVYAGNDFTEITYVYKRFQHEEPASWPMDTLETRRRALLKAKYAMGQCYNSAFALARLRGDYETSRAAAIQLCTEMKQVCDERGIHMLVCLIPPACDCKREQPHEDIERARALLGLTPEELRLNSQLAAELLADLARAGVATLDMTPIFDAQPRPPFWDLDLHMDLEGHRLIAAALEPLVQERLAR
jgi:hypothetical protein